MGQCLRQKDWRLSRNILIVGGQARTARAFRRFSAANGVAHEIALLCRRPETALTGEHVHLVPNYFAPPQQFLAGADVVVNFVGIARGDEAQMHHLNAEGPAALARRARDSGVSHFVHVSSLSVYGRAEEINHTTPEHPSTPYGRTKLMGDKALLALTTPGFKVSLLRVPTLFDARGGKVTQLAKLMQRTGFFPAPAVPQPRSVMHLHNFAIAMAEVIRQETGGVLLAADPDALDIARLAQEIQRQTGNTVRAPRIPASILGLLALLAPGLHDSLFRKSVICPQVRIALPGALGFDAIVADIIN